MKILVAEKSFCNRSVVVAHLHGRGHHIIEAVTAEGAIEAINVNDDLDLVVAVLGTSADSLDCGMHRKDKSGLKAFLRARKSLPKMKLCLVSDGLSQDLVDEASKLGAEIFAKPLDVHKFCERFNL